MAKADLMDFDKALELFEPVLGFEVHVELSTKTKMFSDAPNPAAAGSLPGERAAEPNTQITPVDLGLPGSLPVVNEQAVRYSISLGLALGCQIAPSSKFARKNYFYPDTPKNYQISQYDEPIAFEGSVEVELEDGRIFHVPIERAHMEEDAGKLTHVGGSTGRIQGAEYSLVDYNRAGVPLVEIVTKPIFGAEHDAPALGAAYVSTIRDIVRSLGISEARMERGNLRCDANVSLRPRGQEKLGTRTETKNVNSLRSVERAVRYEIQRQAPSSPRAARSPRRPGTGTRTAAPRRPVVRRATPTTTATSRSRTCCRWCRPRNCVHELRAALPEQPVVCGAASKADWGFGDQEFQDIVNAGLLTEVLEPPSSVRPRCRLASGGWVRSCRTPNSRDVEPSSLITPHHVSELIALVESGELTDRLARQVLEGVIAGEGSPEDVVKARGLKVVSDDGALIAAIDEALAAQPDVLEKIRDGKVQAAGAVIGAVMKAMKGTADAARVRELVLERAQS